jgi:hypothetical protein
LLLSANSQADSTMNAGLPISDGWKECPPMRSHRRAPLISGPDASTPTIMPTETTSTSSANRRICRGESSDTPSIRIVPVTATSRCRSTK